MIDDIEALRNLREGESVVIPESVHRTIRPHHKTPDTVSSRAEPIEIDGRLVPMIRHTWKADYVEPPLQPEPEPTEPNPFDRTYAREIDREDVIQEALHRMRLELGRELESASYIDRDERPDAVEAEPEIEPTRKMIPEQIGALMQEGETFEEARDRLTPELNRELAKLKNARGLAGEDLEREAEIETLLGMLSRLGEG